MPDFIRNGLTSSQRLGNAKVLGKNDDIPKKQTAAAEDATASVPRQEEGLEEFNGSGREAFTQKSQPLPSTDNAINATAMSASLQTEQETDNAAVTILTFGWLLRDCE